jgi:hypothetical protein
LTSDCTEFSMLDDRSMTRSLPRCAPTFRNICAAANTASHPEHDPEDHPVFWSWIYGCRGCVERLHPRSCRAAKALEWGRLARVHVWPTILLLCACGRRVEHLGCKTR